MCPTNNVCSGKGGDFGTPFVCTRGDHAGGQVRSNFFGDKGMALGSALDQMADLLPVCTQTECWGVLRF